MFDDARWGDDARDRDVDARDRDRDDDNWHEPGHRPDLGDGNDARSHDHHSRTRSGRSRDRDDDGPQLGRGPSSNRSDESGQRVPDRRDERWPERENGPRSVDPREVFTRDLDLPRGHERERVHDAREREYTLRGSETRTLATVGAFRVVSARDLRDHDGRPADPRSGDLRHLREQGLVRTERLDGHRDRLVVLTDRGRDLLKSHQHERYHDHRQEFYARLVKPREVEHDTQVFGAYLREADKLAERGARVDRIVLDYELKRDYQKWLHEHDRDRDDYDGHPDRDPAEIAAWAYEHDIPYFDEQVHFPDLRIEYEDADGRWDHVDVEVLTIHYRGSHGAAAARSGFSGHRGSSSRIGGRSGGSRGGGGYPGGLAEEFLD